MLLRPVDRGCQLNKKKNLAIVSGFAWLIVLQSCGQNLGSEKSKTETSAASSPASQAEPIATASVNEAKSALRENSAKMGAASNQTGTDKAGTGKTDINTQAGAGNGARKNEPSPIRNGIVVKPGEDYPAISAHTNLVKLDNDLTICSVNGAPIPMGEFRRQFRAQQQEMQASLSTDQKTALYLLRVANLRKITLDKKERDDLIKTGHLTGFQDKQKFNDFLKKNKLTEKQFDQQVVDIGLAAKTGTAMIENGLLPQLIKRQILCQAAEENGFTKQALNKYYDIQKSDNYKKMQKATGFTDQDLQDEIVKNQLADLMIQKIEKDNLITDKDLRAAYEKYKSELKHGERLRVSQIVFAAPKENLPHVESLKSKIEKESKLTGAALDQRVTEEVAKKKAKAQSVLNHIKQGADFATTANENSDDPSVMQLHNGGDSGWREKAQVAEELIKACDKLKVNEVCPNVVETSYGFHIVKLTGRENAGVTSFEQVKEQLRNALQQKHEQDVVTKWLADRRKQIKVVLAPEFVQAIKSTKTEEKAESNAGKGSPSQSGAK
jgi:peptidyl-prolyl cis-trans isomerase C